MFLEIISSRLCCRTCEKCLIVSYSPTYDIVKSSTCHLGEEGSGSSSNGTWPSPTVTGMEHMMEDTLPPVETENIA